NEEITIPAKDIRKGDIFVVRPGEKIPVDGIIIEGATAVDESALTGESIPTDKKEEDEVYTATINKAGFIKCEATRVGKDTTLARIIKTVEESAATKAPIAKLADKISGIFVPAVIAIAAITFIAWQLINKDTGFALARAICVLVVSCPCALGLATPVAIMVGNGVGAKKNILFKTSEAMQETGRIKIVALDKTGTITEGKPRVTDIEGDREETLKIAAALEDKSEHPIAKAIMAYIKENNIEYKEAKDFRSITGSGVEGTVDGIKVEAGRARNEKYEKEGKTPISIKKDGKEIGIIAVADTIKADSREAISELKKLGIRTVMLTGDNRQTAEAIAKEAGIDEVIAEVRPEGKEEVIRKLKKEGKTAMAGDGINDAPALTTADIGIAIGAGADIAIDAADVVLMRSSIKDVVTAIKLSRKTYTNIKENLFWALIYNVVLIPLAAGVYGLAMDPMYGAAAMSLSSFFVVTNALRLNRFKE
ncbi:MAG: cadmium-translocating P-type ATPase, partial [Clostridiales bacterium]|nr:cadmium-translocating P-type ATPase [Clostridiales bacterium]